MAPLQHILPTPAVRLIRPSCRGNLTAAGPARARPDPPPGFTACRFAPRAAALKKGCVTTESLRRRNFGGVTARRGACAAARPSARSEINRMNLKTSTYRWRMKTEVPRDSAAEIAMSQGEFSVVFLPRTALIQPWRTKLISDICF